MTIDHASAFWGYGTHTTATLAGRQLALRTGRLFPVAPSTALGTATIRPYVIPWTPTVDQFGVAFPSGIVGVVSTADLPSPLTTINTDYATKWADLSGGSAMVAVPAVLPVGYTASLHVPFRTSAWSLARLPTASGWDLKTWLPSTTPWGADTFVSYLWTPAAIAAGTNATIRTGAMGWRNLGLWTGIPISDFYGPSLASGSVTFRVSHNADGSAVGSTGDGDTIDGSHTFQYTDFTDIGSFGGFNLFNSSVKSFPTLSPTLGTPTQYVLRVTAANIQAVNAFGPSAGIPYDVSGASFRAQESFRCDIPYPVTLVGQGDLIAPGGYVP